VNLVAGIDWWDVLFIGGLKIGLEYGKRWVWNFL